MSAWSRRRVGTVVERHYARLALASHIASLDDVLPVAEYVYGLDVDMTLYLDDMHVNDVLLSASESDRLCARASQAFRLGNVRWSLDDFLNDTFQPMFRVSKAEFSMIYDVCGIGSWCRTLRNGARVNLEECMLVWLRRMGSRSTLLETASETFTASPTRICSMFNLFVDQLHAMLSKKAMSLGIST